MWTLNVYLLVLVAPSLARTWHNVAPMHGLDPLQPFDMEVLLSEADPFTSVGPEPAPTPDDPFVQAPAPSMSPTVAPTTAPTMEPTAAPTGTPTDAPTAFPDLYPFNEPPTNPDPWYFNYDDRTDAMYGPGYTGITTTQTGFTVNYKNNQWSTAENPPDNYWREFSDDGTGAWQGVLANSNPERNRCHRVGMQSPIDVRHNGQAECLEHHEVRSLVGDFRITGDKIVKKIESNKLRFVYDRRPCGDLNNVACQEPDPPHADFPEGWGGFADVMHVDFKVPSEHTINGKRYDGEMQVYHLHPGRRRMPTVATAIQATPDGYNWYFEGALKAFEFIYERDEALCAATQRRGRQLVSDVHDKLGAESSGEHVDYTAWGDYSTILDSPDYQEHEEQIERSLQNGRWDPHHEMLVPSIHFYRYEGSLTEPPCGEWISWFITDKPMIISTEQLERMKNILFNHRDYACRRTSTHYEESVARPIQETAGRPIYLCTSADFVADP